VVAPFSAGTNRSLPYHNWLRIIETISKRRPVVVVGRIDEDNPIAGMSAGMFYQKLQDLGESVINLIGESPLRTVMSIIGGSAATITLDSGLLYVALGLNKPAISIWGPHHPGVRIGYSAQAMDLAIWHQQNCPASPCFAYHGFPEHKCPTGAEQRVCECLKTPSEDDVLAKLTELEK